MFFVCDPEKAKDCKKETCILRGGDCHITSNPLWAEYINGYPVEVGSPLCKLIYGERM